MGVAREGHPLMESTLTEPLCRYCYDRNSRRHHARLCLMDEWARSIEDSHASSPGTWTVRFKRTWANAKSPTPHLRNPRGEAGFHRGKVPTPGAPAEAALPAWPGKQNPGLGNWEFETPGGGE
eukprot:FR737708.1.p3 GENE.FR737708.1~~FR737708.1.p3  ORF type:complete len:123 (+),score=13.94 FR737708.1:630-998(+)